MDITQVSYSPERAQSNDQPTGTTSPVAGRGPRRTPVRQGGATVGPKDAKLGAQVGTTSLTTITEVWQARPTSRRSTTPTTRRSRRSQASRSTGMVVDLPTASYVLGTMQRPRPPSRGQLGDGGGRRPEHFSAALDKDSALTALP